MAQLDISTSPTRSKKKTAVKPFYQKQSEGETSAEIINEARTSLRTLRTNRPCTPKDEKRTLFSGSSSTRSSFDRPPSAFSLGARHFDGSGSRPSSSTRLLPLENKPSLPSPASSPPMTGDVTLPVLPKPPSMDPNRPVSGKRNTRAKLMHALSQDGDVVVLPKPLEMRSYNPHPAAKSDDSLERRVHSGPKERTQPPFPGEKPTSDEGGIRVRSADSVSSRSTNTSRGESGYSSGQGSAGSRSDKSGKRDNFSPEEALYWNTSILPVLEDMDTLSGGVRDSDVIETLCLRCSELYGMMKERGLLDKRCKRRSQVLKIIYKLLDFQSARLHLLAARMILALSVSGQSMTSLCKLLFKVGRVEENDKLFLEEDILDLIINTVVKLDPATNSEPLVYLIGTIKCLTGNPKIVQLLSEKKLLPVLAGVLHSINLHLSETGKPSKLSLNVLLQVTPVLRNLADLSENRADFLSHLVLEELCSIMEFYSSEADLMLNICRILSKLTLNHECCAVLGDHPTSFQFLLLLLYKHPNCSDLVVRVCFILGNLTAHNDDCRYCLFNTENALDTLLNTFRHYLALNLKYSKQEAEKDTKSKMDDKSEDVMIKLIRVIAHLSINQDIGALIATNETCVDLLLQVLECHSVAESEELVINTIITVNNLSYYTLINSAIEERHLTIARLLLRLLVNDNVDGMVEAARVFGNLSRTRSIRDFLTSKKVDKMMLMLLDSRDREVVYVACGVLINLMLDEERRPLLKKEAGVSKLIDVLRDFGRTDWHLGSMVCMILCNYTEKMTNSPEALGEQEATSLTDLLVDYLDEEVAMESPEDVIWDEETKELMRSYWSSEFCPVASQLLTRVESCQGDLIPLDKVS